VRQEKVGETYCGDRFWVERVMRIYPSHNDKQPETPIKRECVSQSENPNHSAFRCKKRKSYPLEELQVASGGYFASQHTTEKLEPQR